MNIQPLNNNNITLNGDPLKSKKGRIMQKAIDIIPTHTIKESAKKIEDWEKMDSIISRPAENRAIMGVTALVTQPIIDESNHRVDKETRRVSRNRTISKVLIGTGVGVFAVRGPIYKGILAMTDVNGKSKFSKYLLPKSYLKEITENPKFLKNYRSALAMAVALAAMCITNFVIDAPLTAWLTNVLNEKTKEPESSRENKSTVNNQKHKEVANE